MASWASSFLREHSDDIIGAWEAAVSAGPVEVSLAESALRNHLPVLLRELSRWLEQPDPQNPEGICAAASQHAADRLDHSLQLSQFLRELTLLRATILHLLPGASTPGEENAGERDLADCATELVRVNAGLDIALRTAIEHFVAERDRRMAALRVTEERFADLVRLSPDAVFVHRNERIEFVNPAALALFGATCPEDLLGKSPLAFVHADFKAIVGERIRKLLDGEHTSPRIETKIVRLDGTVRDVEAAAANFDDQHGRAIQVVCRDITERKRAEDTLRQSDRQKSEFLAMLSHELRNPLAPIHNGLYLLDHAPPGSEQAVRARDVVERQLRHLTRLVDDLLDATRISRGKIELRREVVDAWEVIRRTCDDYRASFDERGIELRLDDGAGPVWVDVDVTRLSQIVGNLLSNAVKFTPQGGAVSVATRTTDSRAEIIVRDNGMGIRADHLDRIFEPYAQSDVTLARTRGGLGLGLSLVKGLVALHGGSVNVKSAGPGSGSEFTIWLPSVPAPRAQAPARPSDLAGAGLRLVLIEDNVDAAETLVEVLRLQGHHPRVAFDGRTGIALVRALKPDVVLCDIGLPDIDGYEVARTLRADASLAATKLFALSGYAQPEDRKRSEESGFDAHLQKPIAPEALEQVLRAVTPQDSDGGTASLEGDAAGAEV